MGGPYREQPEKRIVKHRLMLSGIELNEIVMRFLTRSGRIPPNTEVTSYSNLITVGGVLGGPDKNAHYMLEWPEELPKEEKPE